jgi:hypothetical protein
MLSEKQKLENAKSAIMKAFSVLSDNKNIDISKSKVNCKMPELLNELFKAYDFISGHEMPERVLITKIELFNDSLVITKPNGDFTCAAVDPEKVAALLEKNLDSIVIAESAAT